MQQFSLRPYLGSVARSLFAPYYPQIFNLIIVIIVMEEFSCNRFENCGNCILRGSAQLICDAWVAVNQVDNAAAREAVAIQNVLHYEVVGVGVGTQ